VQLLVNQSAQQPTDLWVGGSNPSGRANFPNNIKGFSAVALLLAAPSGLM